MKTAIVSDLHIGTLTEADMVRRPDVRKRLAEALRDADRAVFLGDLVELRDMPLERVLEHAAPILRELSGALEGKPVTIVPGNHDHRLIEPVVDLLRAEGTELPVDWEGTADASPLGAALARLLPDSEVTLAYPGVRLRSDVYALHGHYLDLHMTVPRVESVLGRAMARRILGRDARFDSPADYERALGPIYSLSYGLAQSPASRLPARTSNLSRHVWAQIHGDGRRRMAGFLLARVAIPAGVAALNRAGVGPFSTDLSGEHLRGSGLRAIAQVLENLGVESGHAIFGHTHRHGPLEGEEDEPGWRTPSGVRVWNTGSWYLESVLMGHDRRASAYWPGGVIYVHDSGPPEPVNVLRDLELL